MAAVLAPTDELERYERRCPEHHLAVDDDLRCPGPPSHKLCDRTTPVWDIYDTMEKRYTYRTKVGVTLEERQTYAHRKGRLKAVR